MTHIDPGKNTLVRRLALAKLRELKRQGMSYGEIGRRYGGRRGGAGNDPADHRRRLTCAQLLCSRAGAGEASEVGNGDDAALFLRALDTLEQGLAFYDRSGELLTANRPLTDLLEEHGEGIRLRDELTNFAEGLWRLTRLRRIGGDESVEEIAVQEVPLEPGPLVMKGSYIGLDLFGSGASVLVVLERPPHDPLSPQSLQERFALTPQQCRIAQLLAEGSSNADIAEQVMLSPHTIRRHTEHILRKLDARSRAEAVSRILRH